MTQLDLDQLTDDNLFEIMKMHLEQLKDINLNGSVDDYKKAGGVCKNIMTLAEEIQERYPK